MPDGYFLNPRDYALFEEVRKLWPWVKDVVNRVRNLSGTNGAIVSNTPAGIVISAPKGKENAQTQSIGSSGILRCIITTAGFAGTGGPVIGVKLSASDGSAFGSEFYCIPTGHRAVGEYLFAYRAANIGNTGVSYNPGSGVVDIEWVETGTRGMLFAVRVSSDGGVSGTNQSANCTYTYTVKDAANLITLGTTIALTGKGNGWRALKLELTAGSYGMARINDSGVIELRHVDEYPASEQDCT